jgi:hypothetical protein
MGRTSQKDKSECEFLLDLWEANICPYCGKKISEGTRVGSGRKREGGFCSLTCYTEYYQFEIRARISHLVKVRARQDGL